MEIEKDDTLYVLSYRLPLACARDESGKLTFEWLTMLSDSQIRQAGDTKVMRSMSRHATYVIESLRQLRPRCNVWFVGGLGVHVAEEEREQVMETLSREYQCIPIFLPKDMGSQFEDLCHDVLKPVFHFVHPTSGALSRTFDRSSTSWQLYCEVNNYYVTPVVEHCNEGDFVFVFDPELLMAPNLIGSRARTANVGFFFNVPFPSSEIFRTLPVRKQILTSLLNANFIQFHDYTYARHFLSCCSTLLGLEHRPTRGGLTQVHFHGHSCYIRAAHVGIDAAALQQRMHEPGIQREIETWNERFMTRGKHVVLAGYADMDPLSGITLSLKAFRNILRENEKYRSCMLFVQVAIPLHDSRGDVMHAEYVDQIKKEAAAIEEDFPGSLLMYYEKMPFAPRCALFSVCDALVMASVRHGV
jgi:trehalose 6-phosphate synthase/phosphatase